jgi:glycosyltransferase involved in cell wall biosynthesis
MLDVAVTNPPLVSVVTPFFNAAPYFEQCIESVLAQTYTNIEYILQDNCSTDGSAVVAESYARRDSRIRVVRNREFLSMAGNHNSAVRQISPDAAYCKVLQADDWLFPNCLSEMVRVARAAPSIGIVSAYTLIERDVYLSGLPFPSEFVPGKEICRRLLLEGLNVLGSPTATLIRADLIRARNPFYDERSPIDDLEVCLDLLQECDFGFVNQVLTFTRRDNVSAITTMKKFGLETLSNVMVVKRYGPELLSKKELDARSRAVEWHEYRLLAKAWLGRQPTEFWDFHRRSLKLVGHTISNARIARHVLAHLIDKAFNPKQTIEQLLRRS